MNPRLLLTLGAIAIASPAADAQSLRGSQQSIERQRSQALAHDYSLLRTVADVNRFVGLGLLVPVRGGPNYELSGVSFPYARAQVRTFIERLSAQYHAACGERLVVTSLTRPISRQPRNASEESVHPAGMAVDLRVSRRTACRKWLDRTLLSLEATGVIEATRENNPPHYHVAVFPRPYEQYVSSSLANSTVADVRATENTDAAEEYIVDRGDSLWLIARRSGTTVSDLKSLNGISSDRILPGQRILIPAANN